MESELQRLLEQIESSYQAAQHALTSFAIMAPHEFIQRRMEEIEIAHEKIAKLVGNEFKATDMVVRALADLEEKGQAR